MRWRDWLAIAAVSVLCTGCVVEPTSSLKDFGTAQSHSPIDSEWYNACHSYCAHMYDEPDGCDEDEVGIEGDACHIYCNLGSDALTEPCRAALIAAYECVVNESVTYTCETASASPQSSSDECAERWSEADSC